MPSGAQNSAFTVTVTFTESVTDFAENELVVGGTASTTVSSFTGSGTIYTATITPTTDGTVTLSVAANVAEDAASNGNTAATTQTVNVDVTRPGVSITVVSDDVKKAAFNVDVVFTETVTGFEMNELSVSGAGARVLRRLRQWHHLHCHHPSRSIGDSDAERRCECRTRYRR